jgi:L-iditol 2-dehydrogenase
MKALLKESRGTGDIVLKDIKEPEPRKNELKIKVHAAGICGTDIHIMRDEYPCNAPVVLGHEYSGIVEEVGSEVQGFKKGDRVISLTAVVTCGNCKFCYEGLLMLCDNRLSIGSGVNGAMAEYLVVPAHLAFKIPDEISLDEAALSEPLACVVRSVIEKATVKAGDYVLVSGPGTMGFLTMQVAMASGGKVVVTGTSIDKERLALAKKLGAYDTIVVDQEDAYKRTEEITEGCGFDVAFECAGAAPSANTCLKLLKKTGLYVQVGLYGESIQFDHDLALKKEINMTNSYASERTSWERALRLLKFKQVNVAPLVSAKLPIEEWQKGFDMAINKEGYKILLMPNL